MKKRLNLLINLLLKISLIFAISFSLKAKTVRLNDQTPVYPLGKYISILEDKEGTLTFDDILKGNHPQKYFTVDKDAPNLGFSLSTFWVKFTLTNETKNTSSFFFVYEFPGIDRIELYQNLEGTWKKEISGDLIPFVNKKIPHHLFPFKIFPKKETIYYMKIQNTAAMQIPLKIYTSEAYYEDRVERVLIVSLFIGILLVMFGYHLIIYFSTKMILYVYYCFFLFGVMSLTLAISGFGGQYVLPHLVWFNNLGIIFGVGSAVFGLSLFLYNFLELSNEHRYYKYSYRAGFILAGVYYIFSFYIPLKIGMRVLVFTIAIPLGTLITWTVLAFLGKQKSSKYVLYGFTALIAGGLIKFAHGVGFLPTNFLWKNGFYLGVVAQLLLFSLGLANLINQLKQEALTKAKIISNLNKDLEKKVIRRTEELKESLASINILMDNMAQSVFAIDEQGIITEPVSKYSYDIFGEEIEGKSIWDTLLKDLDPKQTEYSTLIFVFSTCFGVDDLQWLMVKDTVPKKFHFYLNGKIKSLKTRMRPIYHNELLDKIMFIVEDVTEIEKLEADIKRQREESNLKIEKLQSIVSNSKESLVTFFKESFNLVDILEDDKTEKDDFLRSIHTLKGLSRLYGLNFLSSKIHTLETEIIMLYEKGSHKKNFAEEKTNNVEQLIGSVDSALEAVKEVYGDLYDPNQNNNDQEIETIEVNKALLKNTYNDVSQLLEEKNYSPILSMIEKLSKINIKNMATNLKNIVDNTAKKLEKKVLFQVTGDNSYLPQEDIAILKESFIHLLTNCVDHGIEQDGELNISVKETAETINITIQDDGRGIDEAAVLKKALEKKILTEEEAEDLKSTEIKQLIFRPSFSTREGATETSGRGIGMDVVKQNIEKLGGKIQIEDRQTSGTTFVISLPHFLKKSA